MQKYFGTLIVVFTLLFFVFAFLYIKVITTDPESLVIPVQNKAEVRSILGLTPAENEKETAPKPDCLSVKDGDSISSVVERVNNQGHAYGYDAIIQQIHEGEDNRVTFRQALASELVIYPGDLLCVANSIESFK
jgi:hypothetical protein